MKTPSRIYSAFILAAFAVALAAFGPSLIQAQKTEKAAPKGIDFSQVLQTDEGKPMTDMDGKTPLTLQSVSTAALLSSLPSDQGLSGQQKYDLFDLAHKIKAGPQPVKLSETELKTLRDRIGSAFGPAVVGPAWQLLDPALK
jgi:hypothetical protein